jgi:hypothetical protein
MENSRVGPTGSDRGELLLGVLDSAIHFQFGFSQKFVNHACS